jgi:hypothetical protein
MSEQQPLIAPLERLGLEVERMARAAEQDAPRRRRGPRLRRPHVRRPGLVLAFVLLLLAVAAAAIAASGLLSGDPVRGHGPQPTPNEGVGAVVPDTARLTALRVADPGGGPPWGLRTVRTTRGETCMQVGRVAGDQLGVLGQDGAFANDGAFHAIPPTLLESAHCAPRDAAGHAFLSLAFRGVPAAGIGVLCAAACPRADLRYLVFGLLGPHGTSVDYRDPATGRTVTRRAVGPDHAYLVVTRPAHPATGVSFMTSTPGHDLAAVHYDDGTTCVVHAPRLCPLKGYASHAAAAAAIPRTAIHASIGPSGRYGLRPLAVRFRAPVATPDASRFYIVTLKANGRRADALCGFSHLFASIEVTSPAGVTVGRRLYLKRRCHGVLTITIRLHQAAPGGANEIPYSVSGETTGDPLVGTTTVRP